MILRGQNHENIMREIFSRHQIAICGLRSALIKKLKKTDPNFFRKECGSVFFNFLIRALLRPQIAIRQRTNISRIIFSWFWPLKIKISGKNYMVITLSGCLTILAFKISKKLNFDLKIGILKMLSKNSVSSTLTATLEIWWYLIHKMTNLKKF